MMNPSQGRRVYHNNQSSNDNKASNDFIGCQQNLQSQS